jgi:crossover junction endodeoxyribonuclease RusA
MYVRVMGLPQQQGSKNPWGGEANKKLAPWRGHVTQTVGERWGDAPLLTGPVKLNVVFVFPRPKAHYRTNGSLKPNAPEYKTSAPDLDKLQRAIGDALTGTAFRDDAQVAVWEVTKRYAEKAYCDISIIDLSGGSEDDARRSDALGEGPRSELHRDAGTHAASL